MIELAIMIEGQNGLTWARWQAIANLAEELGFAGLYRSDHYTNAGPPDKESLELFTSLTWLASHTKRIEFGPLVSPFSFRHPTMVARYAAAIDDLSNGRLWLGLGAGWQEREHKNYGLELLDMNGRFARFQEGLEVVSRLLGSNEPVDFSGDFYNLSEAILLPRPQRSAGPPILIGGNGPRRTLPLVAQYAREWNAVYIPPQTFTERNALLDELLAKNGREAGDVRRSLMTGLVFAQDDAELQAKIDARGGDVSGARERGVVIGTPNQIVEQLGEYAEAGVQRIMLQWIDLEDLDGLEALGTAVLPQLS